MRDVTIDVEYWRRIILDNQHEFPVLRNDYAWSCGICILNNQEFKPEYITGKYDSLIIYIIKAVDEGWIIYNPVLTILQGTNLIYNRIF